MTDFFPIKPEIKNKDFNSGIYSWVEGEEISTVSMGKIKKCVLFVNKLKEINDVRFENFNLASEACLSGEALKQQIITRLNNLNKAGDSDKDLKNFILYKNDTKYKVTSMKFYETTMVINFGKKKDSEFFINLFKNIFKS